MGDTVRRPWRRTSAATRALLLHLEEVGFDGAPRHLGTDDRGREVLSYVVGQAVTRPYPGWALDEAALRSVADLLRSFHEAVAGFDPSPHRWPGPVPDRFRTSLVTHNDPNLDNVVFRDGRAVALIDFDLAAPGSRVWEVAAAARLWAPLRLDGDVDDARRGAQLQRLVRFVTAYGLDSDERARLPEAVLANHDWLYGIVADEAAHGHQAFSQYWREGGAARSRRTRQWYVRDLELLRDAVAG
ncbi:phosphotransferase [Jannaschia sp. R86511]|uniref:phosphotransferase n=1 Tax=Jannaschia sp. R86511 TaxID=3093853 RepID=UPI0036D262E2